MRTLLTFMLLTAAVLPALSQAQTVDICDRTPQVRDKIMQVLETDDCGTVDAEDLASVTSLYLSYLPAGEQLTTLQAGDFDGLTSLQWLDLGYNQLTA